ncbi:MAG: caspase family protein, partial [Rudaea sp.]
REQLAAREREIRDRQSAAEFQERELEATKLELARQKSSGTAVDAARVQSLQAEIDKRNAELDRQKQEIARLSGALAGDRDKVTKLAAGPADTATRVDVDPPSIQILDPSVVLTRDVEAVAVRAGVTSRPVVGHVKAPAGLVSLTANDVAQQVDAEGFFKTNVTLGPGRTRVTLVAVDRQSKRAVVEFFLEQDAGAAKAATRPAVPGLELGNYYALLIGNQNYQHLRQLNSPEADVKALGALLQDRYGFKVKTLVDATRYDILTELNRYMETLTDKDNLLIYYAGHGEIEKASQEAFWLPVDADPGNDSNWISSDDLTRKIGPMRAKHILVVADSCYSGVLTRSSISRPKPNANDEERYEWLKTVAAKKSRHVLSSGGKAPVMDGGGGKHSLFASVLLDALSVNDDVLDGKHLGEAVSMRVLKKSKDMKFGDGQLPDYRPIRFADNDGGEFLFPKPRTPAGARADAWTIDPVAVAGTTASR